MQFRTVGAPDGAPLDALIVPVFKEGDAADGTPAEARETAEWVAREQGPAKLFTASTHLRSGDDGSASRLVVVAAGKRDEYDIQRAWQICSAGVKALWSSTASRIGICLDLQTLGASEAVQSAVEGTTYAMWRPETHRSGADDRMLPPLEDVLLIGGETEMDSGEAIRNGQFVGEAVNWSRWLANEPGNLMTPTRVASEASEMAAESGMAVEVLDEDACRELGMGSYLSVTQGSEQPGKFIVLRYHGRDGDGYDLGLVGKGITFDSGGISIKPAEDMHMMKYDMSGAAAVMAAIGVIARMKLPVNVICAAPCTENLPGSNATKPGDVFTSMSGKTVEVINTDAEGRLVLIDGVTFVQREGATRVVDVATLTGAIRIALGRHYTGLFGRPEGFVDAVRRAGERSGERLWPMPLTDEYRDEIKSDIADIKNIGNKLGGATHGAAFVDAVVDEETEWVHLDIASTAWFEEDRAFSPKGPQGPTVRTIVELASSIGANRR